MDVEIEQLPALRAGTVRHVGPYNQIPHAFEKLGAIVGPAGLIRPGAVMIAIFHDDPETTPVDRLRSDAAISIAEDAKLPAGLNEARLPAGRYAKTTHIGSYEHLGDVWARFMGEWLPSSGYRLGPGGTFEIYRNTPGEVPKEQLHTDLFISID